MRISDWSSDVCSSDLRFGAVGQKIALALFVDDPQREPYPQEARRPESRRAPGELRVDDGDHGGALFPCAAPARQGGGEAACRAGAARDPLSDRKSTRLNSSH